MRIAFLSSLDLNLYLFRLDIMLQLKRDGHEIFAIIPEGKYFHLIAERGIEVIDYNLSRGSLNPFDAFGSILELKDILKSLNLDLLHTFTVKPNIFGTIAGKMARVPKILNLVEGLGSFYVDNSIKSKIVRAVIEKLYKTVFKWSDRVVFVNSDDPKYLIEKGIVPKEKVKIIKSVGVNISEFSMENIPLETREKLRKSLKIAENSKVVIMIGRAILHKGTVDFYKSAEILRDKDIIFLFVGGLDDGNKFGMSREFMKSGNVLWLDWRDDIKELISISDLVVLPSYREGVPRTLLEACSMGKPIVATDTVGCRESVDNGENGFLIPIEAPEILAEKISQILENSLLYSQMSKKSREKAEREFDINFIVKQYIELYREFGI
jgi:N,N'-diacetylbacillosaminyl-diphospho-undecaprenol alpha-1,3-N-acetylgalactosaminyltransferase